MDRQTGRSAAFPETLHAALPTNLFNWKEQIDMKRILSFVLALALALSLTACGGKADGGKDKKDVTMTAQEIMDTLKEKLGDSFECDVDGTEDSMSSYWGLDMSKVESWAAESNSNSSLNMDCAVVLKVKDGYAAEVAAALQKAFDQVVGYARMYNMDLQRVLQGRLYSNGAYVALIIEGQKPDESAGAEEQAKFAADEAGKVDSAWKALFGSAGNALVVPDESDSGSDGFDLGGGLEG